MKITKRQLLQIIDEGYNSMSNAGKALAQRAKRQFMKNYPDVKVGIDGREGWITVDGKKAVNLSQASGSPLSEEDVIDKMKQAYLGHPMQEGSIMKITKRQLRRIIKEERVKVLKEYSEYPSHSDASDHLDDMMTSMEDLMIKYVDSGWLSAQDNGSLARDLEKVLEQINSLNNAFRGLAGSDLP